MARYRAGLVLLAALTAGALSFPSLTQEPNSQELAWAEPVWIAWSSAGDARPVPGILEQPGGWMPGDAAVVLLPGHTGPDAARERLIARLLHEGAAVLVLYAPRGVAADVASANPEPRALPRDFLPVLFGALMVLRRDYGAGEVVALGHGAAAVDEAALQAASEITASAFLGSDAQGYAATAGLGGPGRAAGFEPGATPPSSAEWPARVPLLCAILGSAAAELMQLQPVEITAAMAERDCSRALLRPNPFAAVQDLP